MGGCLHKYAPPESLSGVLPEMPAAAISAQRGSFRAKSRALKQGSTAIQGGSIVSGNSQTNNLPPLQTQKINLNGKSLVFSFLD
jgi:hypothetical protein